MCARASWFYAKGEKGDKMISGHRTTWREQILEWKKDPEKLFDTRLRHILEVGIELDSDYLFFQRKDEMEFGFKGIPYSSAKVIK